MGSPYPPQWQNQSPGAWPAPGYSAPPPKRRGPWLWLVPMLAVVVAAAVVVPLVLTGGDEHDPPAATGKGDSSPRAGDPVEVPAEGEKTPRPKDRDSQAVAEALRLLDPCKLLDLGVAKKRGRPNAVTIPKGPTECQLVSSRDYDPTFDPGLKLTVGVESEDLTRYAAAPLTLAGGKAYEIADRSESSSSCLVQIPVSFERAIELYYSLLEKADLCPIVRQYAAGTIAKLRNPDAVSVAGRKSSTKPQRPLVYGPDENDTGAVGACVDFGVTGGLEDCEPYHDVPVPTKPEEIMAAPRVNRNVQCAVFNDAIEAAFGKGFAPITWGAHCYFVDPTHVVAIRVNVDPANPPSDYGHGRLYSDRAETTIAGLAAVTFWDERRSEFDIYVSPNNNVGQPGNLHISLDARGGRGKLAADLDATLSAEQVDQATQVMSQVVTRYFS